MPNWTYNHLLIEGDKEELDRFFDLIHYVNDDGEDVFSILETLVPCPTELSDTTKGYLGSDDSEKQQSLVAQQQHNVEKYGYPTWYEWRIDNWGCKWSDCDTALKSRDDSSIVLTFNTPWAPPQHGLETISQLFPSLRFVLSFTEEGNFFVGAIGYINGHDLEVEGDVNVGDAFYEAEQYDEAWEALDNERAKCATKVRNALLSVTN